MCSYVDFSGILTEYIEDFRGPCTIRVKEDAIIIKKSNGKEVGNWPYVFIRTFRYDNEKMHFSFVSGRRGPFGVAEYTFKLQSRTFFSLMETVNKISEIRGAKAKHAATKVDSNYRPPVPAHGRASVPRLPGSYEYMYEDLGHPTISRHNRRTSNPDLSRELLGQFIKSDFKSTRSNPSAPNSPKLQPKDSPLANSPDPTYQIPRPANESIYNIPRPVKDPRNDYQIPRPMDKTYMVPTPSNLGLLRPHASSDTSILLQPKLIKEEHGYEDPENI